jgi:hypothetical protein
LAHLVIVEIVWFCHGLSSLSLSLYSGPLNLLHVQGT